MANPPARPLLLLLAVFSATPALGQYGLPDPVDPRTYVSPSGKWRLDVDASSIDGSGGADYVLRNGGTEAWSGRQPFTLLAAEVTDHGSVAGYAYSGGLMMGEGSKIHLLIVNPQGEVVLNVTEDRAESRVIHGGPEPWVNDVLLDEETDRVTFRLDDYESDERWRTFRLSDGKPTATYQLRGPVVGDQGYAWLNDVREVKGTPFNLVAWGVEDPADDRTRPDIRFSLLDTAGNSFWRHDLAEDRAPRATQGEESDFYLPGSLPHGQRGEFEIRVFRSGERVLFRVTGDSGSGFRVAEVRRGYYAPQPEDADPPPSVDEAAVEAATLPPITLGLNRDDDANPTRGIQEFDVDNKGRFGFARLEATCAVTFILLEGGAPREHALGSLATKPNECYRMLVAWAGGPTWLVTQEFAKGGEQPLGWWFDVDAQTQRPFTISQPLMATAVAGTGRGSVVLLAADENFSETMLLIDSNNREERAFRTNFEADRGELLSPEDIAVSRAGDIAVLDVIRHVIEVFDHGGFHKQSIDLEAKWGREPNYPSGLSADAEGGFFVDDFGAERPLVRIDDTGSIRAESKPRYDNGAATGRMFRVRVAPDGRVWGSDGEALLQLDSRGVVVDTIGPSAGAHRLGDIAAWTLDLNEGIYAADRRSGGVHVFESNGAALRTCSPPPGQITDALSNPSLSVSIDGRVLLRANDMISMTESFLEFSPTCTATTREIAAGSLWFSPSGEGLWAERYQELALLDSQGEEQLLIARRPDRRWLRPIHNTVVARDGSLAVASGARKDDGDGSERWALSIFHGDGQPRSVTFFPPSIGWATFAFDGRRIVAWDAGRIRVMDLRGHTLNLLAVPSHVQAIRKLPILLGGGGREAWILDGERQVVHRIPLP